MSVDAADGRDAAFEHRLQPESLADIGANVVRQAHGGVPSHQLQRAPHALVGDQVQIRRLAEIDGDRFPQRAIEVRIRRAVRDRAHEYRSFVAAPTASAVPTIRGPIR